MIVESLTSSEVLELLNILKEFIDIYNISMYEKPSNVITRKVFDAIDDTNTITVVIFMNNTEKSNAMIFY